GKKYPNLNLIGFANDTNIIAFGKSVELTCRQIEEVWQTYEEWARIRGMVFTAGKSELLHLTRARRAPGLGVRLGQIYIEPSNEYRFLGVWIDRKLIWKAYIRAI